MIIEIILMYDLCLMCTWVHEELFMFACVSMCVREVGFLLYKVYRVSNTK